MKHRLLFWCLFVVVFATSLFVSSVYFPAVAARKKSSTKSSAKSGKSGKRAASTTAKFGRGGSSSASGKSTNVKGRSGTSSSATKSSVKSGKRAASTTAVGRTQVNQQRPAKSGKSGKRAAATSMASRPSAPTAQRSGKRAATRDRISNRRGNTITQSSTTTQGKSGKFCLLNTVLTSTGAGQFKTSDGVICTRPDNTSVSENATGVIIKCNAGYYDIGTACVVCPAGSYCTNGTKTLCDYGYYSATTGATQCSKCSGDGVTLERGATTQDACVNITCPSGTTFTIPD